MSKKSVKTESKIRVRVKGYDHRVVDGSVEQIVNSAVRTGAKVAGPIPLPTRIERVTMVSSPHVDKRGGDVFEIRTCSRLIDVIQPTPQTIESLSHLNLPAGVDIELKMI